VRRAAVPAVAAVLGVLVGCAGVRLEDGTYVVRRKGYRVGAPPGWTRVASEADLALRRSDLGAGLMAHATCEGRGPTRPLPVLARHLRFGLRNVRELHQAPVTLGGVSGTAMRFRATLDDTPVAVTAVTLAGRGCVYDLVGVAAPERFDAMSLDFARFTAHFAVTGDDRP
jgi:hypothetical protein